jgi:hypothetical protein
MHHVPDHEWASFFFIHGLAECSLRFKPKRAQKKAQLFYSLSLPRLLTFYYQQILYIFWKVVSNRTISLFVWLVANGWWLMAGADLF